MRKEMSSRLDGRGRKLGVYMVDIAEAMAARFAHLHPKNKGWKKVVMESP